MRARNIKPGFFKNCELGELSPLGRLLFIGLWCLADRCGRLIDRPKQIKAELLPYDDVDVNDLLEKLNSLKFLKRYEVSGQKYLEISNFKKHQNPHKAENQSLIPPVPNQTGTSSEPLPNYFGTTSEPARLIPSSLIPDSPSLIPDSTALSVSPKAAKPTPQNLLDLWNKNAHLNLPRARFLTETRKRHTLARLTEYPEKQFWDELITRVNASPLLRGETGNWRASFDWILKPTNLTKILEGNYDRNSR